MSLKYLLIPGNYLKLLKLPTILILWKLLLNYENDRKRVKLRMNFARTAAPSADLTTFSSNLFPVISPLIYIIQQQFKSAQRHILNVAKQPH